MGAQASHQQGPRQFEVQRQSEGPRSSEKLLSEPRVSSSSQAEEARAIQRSLRLEEGPLENGKYRVKKDSGLIDSKDAMRSVCADLAKLRIKWPGETPYDKHIRLLEEIEEKAEDSKAEFLTWWRRYGCDQDVGTCLQIMKFPTTPPEKAMRSAYVTMMPGLQQTNKEVLQILSELSRNFEVKCDVYAALRSHVRELDGLIEEWTKAKDDGKQLWDINMHPLNAYPDDLHRWTQQELLKYKVEQRDFIASKLDASCTSFGGVVKQLVSLWPLLRPFVGGCVVP